MGTGRHVSTPQIKYKHQPTRPNKVDEHPTCDSVYLSIIEFPRLHRKRWTIFVSVEFPEEIEKMNASQNIYKSPLTAQYTAKCT